jgi:hypothetical protein
MSFWPNPFEEAWQLNSLVSISLLSIIVFLLLSVLRSVPSAIPASRRVLYRPHADLASRNLIYDPDAKALTPEYCFRPKYMSAGFNLLFDANAPGGHDYSFFIVINEER